MSVPTSDEIAKLLAALHDKRAALLSLVQSRTAGVDPTEDLVRAIDDIGAQLMVADEELRVQNEQLSLSTRRLDLLAAADEELFGNAPAAYVQTDPDGLIVRYNHAARKLLRLPSRTARSRTIASLVPPENRPAIRSLITKARAVRPHDVLAPLESTVARDDGTTSPVVFVLRRSGVADGALLHWEIQDFGVPEEFPAALGDSSVLSKPGVLATIASAAQELARQETPGMTMHEAVVQARTAIPGCDEAGLTLVKGAQRVLAPAATSELAAQSDKLEQELGEGPCLEAYRTTTLIRSDDLSTEQRWPHFARRAVELGIGSVLAVPLQAPRGLVGSLNLYAKAPHSFDADAELIAATYASHAAIAIMHADLEANLRVGLSTREEIGRAVGILMERHRVTATAAFDMLVYASQRTHRKLRYVALWVNETGEDPQALLR